MTYLCSIRGFPDSSVGKESACNAGDPGSIPGAGRSSGEGIGYPLQYSWASLVAQLVKNLPAMQETWVQSLGWEDLLETGTAAHSSILAWRISWTVYSPWGCRELDTTERLSFSVLARVFSLRVLLDFISEGGVPHGMQHCLPSALNLTTGPLNLSCLLLGLPHS